MNREHSDILFAAQDQAAWLGRRVGEFLTHDRLPDGDEFELLMRELTTLKTYFFHLGDSVQASTTRYPDVQS